MRTVNFLYNVGQRVHHFDETIITGTVVEIGLHGQMEDEMTKPLTMTPTQEMIDNSWVEQPEHYWNPMYRILWDDEQSRWTTSDGIEYNGQEVEECIKPIIPPNM
jgi:hypothetical protein